MIQLNALELLKKKGKSKYWLGKQLGLSGQNLSFMLNNKTKSIRYETLEAMCYIFDCTPNDLLIFVDDEQEGN